MAKESVNITIQNFRNISKFSFEIKPYMFLFGSNGSGKTSVIKALLFLKANIIPLRLNKTIYQIKDAISLGSFNDTVINNDLTKKIRYEIQIVKDNIIDDPKPLYPLSDDFDFLDEYDYKLSYLDFMVTRRKKVGNKEKNRNNNKILTRKKLDININVEFAFDSEGNDLNLFELVDNLSNSKFCLSKKKKPRDTSDPSKDLKSNFDINISLNLEKKIFNLFKNFLLDPFQFGFVQEVTDESVYLHDFWDFTSFPKENIDEATKKYQLFLGEPLIAHIYSIQEKDPWKKLSKNEKRDIIHEIIYSINLLKIKIPKLLNEHLQIFHVPSIRELPKHIYLLNKNIFNKDDYYSIPSFLESELNSIASDLRIGSKKKTKITLKRILKEIDEQIRQSRNHKKKSSDSIQFPFDLDHNYSDGAKITSQLRYMHLAQYIYIEKLYKAGELKLIGLNKISFNLAEASSGLQQILPILFYCLPSYLSVYQNYSGSIPPIVFIEQPELHLHPRLQISLLESLIASKGVNLFIETHSEHFIRKIQVLIAKGLIQKDNVGVYFFYKNKNTGASTVRELQIENNGFFKEPWPDGFFDDSYNLARELIYARKN